jgi:acetoin utilization protein AcuB
VRLGKISVADIMQENPISVRREECLGIAAGLFAEHKIRHLPVVDDMGDIQGVISDRDLLGLILSLGSWKIKSAVFLW